MINENASLMCEISTPYIKCKHSYERERNDGSNRTWDDNSTFVCTCRFIIKDPF